MAEVIKDHNISNGFYTISFILTFISRDTFTNNHRCEPYLISVTRNCSKHNFPLRKYQQMRFQIHYKYYLLQNILKCISNYLSNKNKHWNVLIIKVNPSIHIPQLHKINKAYLLSRILSFETASFHPPLGFGDSWDIRARFSIKLGLSRPTSLEFGQRKIPTNATWKSLRRKHLRSVTPFHSSLHLVFH